MSQDDLDVTSPPPSYAEDIKLRESHDALLAAAKWALDTIDGNYHELAEALEAAIANAEKQP